MMQTKLKLAIFIFVSIISIAIGEDGFQKQLRRRFLHSLDPRSDFYRNIVGLKNKPTSSGYDNESSVVVGNFQTVDPIITTFKSSNRTAEKVNSQLYDSKRHLVDSVEEYKFLGNTTFLQGSIFPRRSVPSPGLFHTVLECYRKHHNLVLRPDDIWTAIMVQFSRYVNANAVILRDQFVNFKGKKELVVKFPTRDYQLFVTEMTKRINETLVNDQVADWILPNFSTTTESDIITNGIVMMSGLQAYFDYTGSMLCGIPETTLLGTVDDWMDIASRVKKLKDYGLEEWATLLKPVLDQFVQAKLGNIDSNFWGDICTVQVIGGCHKKTYLNGWMSVFNVFDKDGKWQGYTDDGKTWPKIDLSRIPSGVVSVPVNIDDHGVMYRSKMFAGHMGQKVLLDQVTLQPLSGWAIARLPDA